MTRKFRRLILTALWGTAMIAVFFSTHVPKAQSYAGDPLFKQLRADLIRDGFSAERINRLYDHKLVTFDAGGTGLYFKHRESKLNYGQFLTPYAIGRAKKYMKRHRKQLTTSHKRYGVDPEIITAVILVETSLGNYLGNRRVISTLSTMASLKSPHVKRALWDSMPVKDRPDKKLFNDKAEKKSLWAYEELKAFLVFTKRENMNPVAIKGSYAGAMGIPQFMPSSAIKLAADGDEDNKTDLFSHGDAIASIARYLSHFGWKAGISDAAAHKILLEYNKSNPYADTLVKISKQLKG